MAITVATYDSTNVYVSGGQVGTVAQIVTAIGNTSVMETVGSVHTIKGNRGLYIGTTSGTTVTLETGETLIVDKTANGYSLRIIAYCEFIMEAGSTLQVTSDSATGDAGGYIYCYGKFTAIGTSESRITINKPRYFRIFNQATTSSADGRIHIEYADIKNMRYQSIGALEFFSGDDFAFKPSYIVRHVLITNDTGTGGNLNYGYGLTFYPMDYSDCIFDDITVEYNYYGIYTYGATAKISNSTFKDSYSRILVGYGTSGMKYNYSQYFNEYSGTFSQPYFTFDTCTFDNNYTSSGSTRAFECHGGASAKLIDCTFSNSYYGIYSSYNNFMFVNNPTFTNITSNIAFSSNGSRSVNLVWKLNLTVTDISGNPLQGANVLVYQSENKEIDTFITNSSGNILDQFGDSPVFTEKQQYSSTPSYYSWSQSGTDCHYMVISKTGYQTYTRKIYFTSNQTITVSLQPSTGPRAIPQG